MVGLGRGLPLECVGVLTTVCVGCRSSSIDVIINRSPKLDLPYLSHGYMIMQELQECSPLKSL